VVPLAKASQEKNGSVGFMAYWLKSYSKIKIFIVVDIEKYPESRRKTPIYTKDASRFVIALSWSIN
jgi:hypothetical protein